MTLLLTLAYRCCLLLAVASCSCVVARHGQGFMDSPVPDVLSSDSEFPYGDYTSSRVRSEMMELGFLGNPVCPTHTYDRYEV